MMKHLRVDHAATKHLQPAGMAAYPASLASADNAFDIRLRRGLRKREVGGTETHLQLLLEKGLQEVVQNPLEITKGDVFIDHKTLHLMKHRRMGDVGITTIDAPGRNHAQRRPAFFHGANLHRRGVRTQQHVLVEIEGIVHGARRVVRRYIQCFEIVVVILDLRPLHHFKTGAAKQCLDALQGSRDRMLTAGSETTARQGNIDALLFQTLLERLGFKHFLALQYELLQHLFRLVDRLPCLRALLFGQFSELFQLLGKNPALAEILDTHQIQLGERLCRGDFLLRLLQRLFKLL